MTGFFLPFQQWPYSFVSSEYGFIMKYSIKDLEIISGIKAHTIRAWEQRHTIFTPHRDTNNNRLYTTEELKCLLNISFLNKRGFKISHLAKYSAEELGLKVLNEFSIGEEPEVTMHHWLLATLEMDEVLFERILSESVVKKGLEQTLIESLFPFMQKIGTLWHAGFVASSHEHFISNLIRRKIISAIDCLTLDTSSTAKVFLLFLPEGEWHELVLLFSHYMIKKKGHQVIYLGQSVPWEDIELLSTQRRADFIITVITFPQMEVEVDFYLTRLSKSFRSSEILLAGPYVGTTPLPKLSNVSILNGPEDLKKYL
ncbi:MAG TPA: MerR family transcriptional regulator [Cytophagaceae bacterium]|jgi:DNA-binding transcriptional MerR regulator